MAYQSWEEYQAATPAPYDLQKFVEESNAKYAGMQYDQRPQEFHDEYAKQLDANKQWQAGYFNQVGAGGGSISNEGAIGNPYVNVWNGAAGRYMSREESDVYGQGPNADPNIVAGPSKPYTKNPVTGNVGGTTPKTTTTGTGVQQPPKLVGGAVTTMVQPPAVLPSVNTNVVTDTNPTNPDNSITGGTSATGMYPVTSYGNDQFVSEGQTFKIASRNMDGTINWVRSDGQQFQNLTPTEFSKFFGAEAANRYYTIGGTQPGATPTATTGQSFKAPSGDTFEIVSRNPNGSITWKRSDGLIFENIDAQTFNKYFPAEAGRWYTQARAINPETETVQGQLERLLSADSPYLQGARARASDRMNARGLMNSTMAGQSGEAAAIDAALPIAQADAGIYGGAADKNFGLANELVQAANQQSNTQLNMKLAADIAKDARQDAGAIAENFEKLKSQLNYESSSSLKAIDHNYKQLNQYSTGATQVMSNFNTQIATILASPDIAQENKQGLIDQLTTLTNNSLIAMKAMYGLE